METSLKQEKTISDFLSSLVSKYFFAFNQKEKRFFFIPYYPDKDFKKATATILSKSFITK